MLLSIVEKLLAHIGEFIEMFAHIIILVAARQT